SSLRRSLADLTARREATAAVHAQLLRSYSPPAIASVSDSLDRCSAEADAATRAIDRAAAAVEPGSHPAGPSAAVDAIEALREGEEHLRRAGHLLDAIDSLREQLAAADAA